MAQLIPGALVQVSGTYEEVIEVGEAVEILGRVSVDGPAQLLRREGPQWLALSFAGQLIRVDQPRPLNAVDDFVLGPGSNSEVLADAMASQLIMDGYCESRALNLRSEVEAMISATERYLDFSRIPAEFEPYYLGVESKEKHALIDLEEASEELIRIFQDEDTRLTRLMDGITPVLRSELGSRITGRTNLMVRQTFSTVEEEKAFQATEEPGSGERETFMSLVKRRRVCMMHFLGPRTGTLKLLPRADRPEITIEATPGKLVMFLTERFRYSHTCSGRTTTLQTWLLGQRPEYVMQGFGGDMSVLAPLAESGVPPPKGESVTVTGIATAIGGDSKDHHCYWLMFNKAGTDTAVKTPITRYDLNVYYMDVDNMAEAQAEGKAYTAHQGYVDGIEFFDAKFFGISAAEAAAMDPNQRKTLEIAYESINMAGIDMPSLKRSPQHIGCFVGVSGSEWGMVPHPADAAGCGGAEAIISNRVNFSLNLKGASQTINTACSAGLVATHTGKLYLKYKDFDPLEGSICCGTQLAYSPFGFLSCCGGGMLSFQGRCFTYDRSADGYLRGEGVSGIYLQRNEYSNKGHLFAAMPASQANQDGKSASITAPNGPSQEKCIKACFREAKYSPAEVDCFETHGTGTALGDPIEVGAFKRIYQQVPRAQPLLVTSSKTNLGHLEGGAGMAGLIKVVLQVLRCESSPNIHLREMNPHLDVEGFPAQFLSEGCVTHFNSCVSGVSSFGFGGTNAHAMAFSQNICNNRDVTKKDYRSLMMQKIQQAAPPEIIKATQDPEDWESNGAPLSEDKIGKLYEVEVDLSGKVVWREVVETPPDPKAHERFGIAGSFNSWSCRTMAEIAGLPGLFGAEVTIGESGEEYFHILGDEDTSQVYYPAMPRCTRKLVDVRGPSAVLGNPEEHAWCIQGQPGSRFRIEFQITARSVLVTWLRIAEALQI
ncbi:unnamed protein product [Durusdinium trenchii]|uniref:Ketosynthase family 3 (KS3) domain-containing protein n=1 Tax=Durusdinium trenchii TaxID=1381693 RepID=A0ABP0LCY6_9DINO